MILSLTVLLLVLMPRYFATIAPATAGESKINIEDQVIQANPILEVTWERKLN